MRKASWNIRNKLQRRLALSLLVETAFSFFLGYYVYWAFYFLILLDLGLTYFRNKKSKEKYLVSFEEREDNLVLRFITPNFKTGEDVMAKDNLTFIEMSRAGIWTRFPMEINFKYNGQWQSYKILGKEAAQFLGEYVTAANTGD